MKIYFSRYRFKAGAEALFMKAIRSSNGIGRYVKGTYVDGIVWDLKGWMSKILSDKREERKDKRK